MPSKDSQGVDGMGGQRLVAQPNLPANATSPSDVISAKPGNTVTNRDSMCLVDQAKVPGGDQHGKSRD